MPKILPGAQGLALGSTPHVGPVLPAAAPGLNRPAWGGWRQKERCPNAVGKGIKPRCPRGTPAPATPTQTPAVEGCWCDPSPASTLQRLNPRQDPKLHVQTLQLSAPTANALSPLPLGLRLSSLTGAVLTFLNKPQSLIVKLQNASKIHQNNSKLPLTDHRKFAISISKPRSRTEGKNKQGSGRHPNLPIIQLGFLHKTGEKLQKQLPRPRSPLPRRC